MFGIFKKKDPAIKLNEKYVDLLRTSHALSTTNRAASDAAYAEAQAVLKEIEALPKQ